MPGTEIMKRDKSYSIPSPGNFDLTSKHNVVPVLTADILTIFEKSRQQLEEKEGESEGNSSLRQREMSAWNVILASLGKKCSARGTESYCERDLSDIRGDAASLCVGVEEKRGKLRRVHEKEDKDGGGWRKCLTQGKEWKRGLESKQER